MKKKLILRFSQSPFLRFSSVNANGRLETAESSDSAGLPQPSDVVPRVSRGKQHLLGVLTEFRRPGSRLGRRVAQADRSSTPGRKELSITSAVSINLRATATPAGRARSRVTLRFPRLWA